MTDFNAFNAIGSHAAGDATAYSCCDARHDLHISDNPGTLALCNDCRSPLRSLELPEKDYDIGSEG